MIDRYATDMSGDGGLFRSYLDVQAPLLRCDLLQLLPDGGAGTLLRIRSTRCGWLFGL